MFSEHFYRSIASHEHTFKKLQIPQMQTLAQHNLLLSLNHLHVAAQGAFLIGRRRLVNRHVDWLLNLLTSAVADQYLLRLERHVAK